MYIYVYMPGFIYSGMWYIYIYIYSGIYIYIYHCRDYLSKILIKVNVATGQCNGENEM